MTRSRVLLALAGPALTALVACGTPAGPVRPPSSDTATPSASAFPCHALPAAIGPDVAGSLAQADGGGSFCVRVGQSLNVFLSVPVAQADSGRWTPIRVSDGAVLHAVPSGALTLVRGVTAGVFAAARPGTSELTSTRPPCAATAPSACPAAQRWQVTIVVRR